MNETYNIVKDKELVQIINKLEVLVDTITGTLEFYNNMEKHFNEPTDSNKLKIFITNQTEELSKLLNEFYSFLNRE